MSSLWGWWPHSKTRFALVFWGPGGMVLYEALEWVTSPGGRPKSFLHHPELCKLSLCQIFGSDYLLVTNTKFPELQVI